jgi:hypothetical protein
MKVEIINDKMHDYKAKSYIIDSKDKDAIFRIVKYFSGAVYVEYIDTICGKRWFRNGCERLLIQNTDYFHDAGFTFYDLGLVQTPYGRIHSNELALYEASYLLSKTFQEVEAAAMEVNSFCDSGETVTPFDLLPVSSTKKVPKSVPYKDKVVDPQAVLDAIDYREILEEDELEFLYTNFLHHFFKDYRNPNLSDAAYPLLECGELEKVREEYKYFKETYPQVEASEIQKAKQKFLDA